MKSFDTMKKLPGMFTFNRKEKTIAILRERIAFYSKIKRLRLDEDYDESIGFLIKNTIKNLQSRFKNTEIDPSLTMAGITALESIEQKIQSAIKELPEITKQLNKLEERNDGSNQHK